MYGFGGPKGGAQFHHFNFHDADDLFAKFFKNHEFDDDPFVNSFFGNKTKGRGNGGFGGFGSFGGFSMFDKDPFFRDMGLGGFGGGSNFQSFSSSSSMGGSMPGLSKSVSTTTRTV